MQSKVKFVTRNEMFVQGDLQSQFTGHATRRTSTSAICYDNTEIFIDEDEIRAFYGQQRITSQLVDKLNTSLHNVYVEYVKDGDGMFWLSGGLGKYVK